jgi:hypothetical protein
VAGDHLADRDVRDEEVRGVSFAKAVDAFELDLVEGLFSVFELMFDGFSLLALLSEVGFECFDPVGFLFEFCFEVVDPFHELLDVVCEFLDRLRVGATRRSHRCPPC